MNDEDADDLGAGLAGLGLEAVLALGGGALAAAAAEVAKDAALPLIALAPHAKAPAGDAHRRLLRLSLASGAVTAAVCRCAASMARGNVVWAVEGRSIDSILGSDFSHTNFRSLDSSMKFSGNSRNSSFVDFSLVLPEAGSHLLCVRAEITCLTSASDLVLLPRSTAMEAAG